jgi:hypothetical protein
MQIPNDGLLLKKVFFLATWVAPIQRFNPQAKVLI